MRPFGRHPGDRRDACAGGAVPRPISSPWLGGPTSSRSMIRTIPDQSRSSGSDKGAQTGRQMGTGFPDAGVEQSAQSTLGSENRSATARSSRSWSRPPDVFVGKIIVPGAFEGARSWLRGLGRRSIPRLIYASFSAFGQEGPARESRPL